MNRLNTISLVLILCSLIGCSGLKPKPIYVTKKGEKASNPDKSKEVAQPKLVEKNDSFPVQIDREKMMAEIENLLGVPYRFGGSTEKEMDCSGFVQYVYKNAVAYPLPRKVIEMVQTGHRVVRDQLQFGDLVFFKNIEEKGTSHVGIYLDTNQFVHASVTKGVIISGLNEPYYNSRYVEARRITVE